MKKEKQIMQYDESFPRYEVKKSVVKKAKYYSVNTAFTVVFISVIVAINILFGILQSKVNLRLDLTSSEIFTLSDVSRNLLDELGEAGKKVEFIICADEESAKQNSSTSSSISVSRYIVETCEGYQKEYSGVSISYVNPTYNPAFYKARGIELNDGTDGAVVMAVYSPDTGRYKLIKSSAVENLEYVSFERRLAASTLFVSKDNLQYVGVISGHGESEVPYYQQILEDNGYVLEYIDLAEASLEKYSLLVIVNPTRTYNTDEIAKIDSYLSNGEKLGKNLIVFADIDRTKDSHLESYLKDEWGLTITSERIFDTENTYDLSSAGVTFLNIEYSEEVISGKLSTEQNPFLPVLLGKTVYINREFESLDNIRTEALLSSSDTSFAKDIVLYQQGGSYIKEEGDSEGPFTIGAIAEKYRYEGTEKFASNVCVFGTTSLVDSVFLSNYYGNTSASAEYILNLTKYLASAIETVDTDIIAIDLSGSALNFSSNIEFILTFSSIVAILPAILVVVGIVILIKRKNK